MNKTGDFIVLVNFRCGRHNKRIDIRGKSAEEVALIKSELVFDRTKFMLVIV